jgi:phage FluMu protein Com
MPIEFRCSHCGKLLRTGDGTAGRQAQCPECATVCTVPGVSTPTGPIPASTNAGSPFGTIPQPPESADGAENPYQSPYAPSSSYSQLPSNELAVQRVAGPAIALIVFACVGMALQIISVAVLVVLIFKRVPIRNHWMFVSPEISIIQGIAATLLGVLILIGAMKMKRLENYGLAMAASIIAMIPYLSPCCLLGLPFGIWALVVLCDSNVKAAFRS